MFLPKLSQAAGDILVASIFSEPRSLNCFNYVAYEPADEPTLFTFPGLVFGRLVDRTSDINAKLKAGFAESWKRIAPDTWQFRLRKGIRFHNGDEMTSQDIKFTLEKHLSDKKASLYGYFKTIKKVIINDKYSFKIVTTGPDVDIPYKFIMFGFVLPKEYFNKVGEKNFFEHPIGAGPFRLIKWEKGKFIELKAFDQYWAGSPKLRRIRFKFVEDKSKRTQMFLDGQLDLIYNVFRPKMPDIIKNPKTTIIGRTGPEIRTLVFMMTKLSHHSPLRNIRVRQAIRHAIDINYIIKTVENGYGSPLAIGACVESFGYDPQLKPAKHDIQLARKLIKEAGYSKGFTITALVVDEMSKLVKPIELMLKKVNINLEVEFLKRSLALAALYKGPRIIKDVWFFNPSFSYADLQNNPSIYLEKYGIFNIWDSKKLVELMKKASLELNPQKREQILFEEAKVMYHEIGEIPLYQVHQIWGVRKHVKGFNPYFNTIPRLENVYLDESDR